MAQTLLTELYFMFVFILFGSGSDKSVANFTIRLHAYYQNHYF